MMTSKLATRQVVAEKLSNDVVDVDLNQPMAKIREKLSQYPIKTRVNLSGSLVVARDIAHAKLMVRESPVWYPPPHSRPPLTCMPLRILENTYR